MLRTTAGWSLTFVLVLGGIVVGCSSKSTDEGTGMGGNGAIVGGSSTGGTTATGTGGSATATGGGRATTTGGTTTAGAATGGGAGLCADTSITCVDATNGSACNPDTGMAETFNCVDEAKTLGIISSGCTKDALNGDSCALDDFSDQACADGTRAASFCENLTSEQSFNAYVNCFQDNNGARELVTCFSTYVTTTMRTSQDCINAEDACLGMGAGGAPPTMMGAGGAGGAP